eukprot:764619-Hanusia_phi.AAC.2
MVSLPHGVPSHVLPVLHSLHQPQETRRPTLAADSPGDLRLLLRCCAIPRGVGVGLNGRQVRWDKERHSICPLDEYSPVTRLQKFLHDVLSWYETHLSLHSLPPFSWLRRAGEGGR